MASFLGVFKSIWQGVEKAANFAEPYKAEIGAIPIVGAPVDIVIGIIQSLETILPATGNGTAKKAAATVLATAALPGVHQETLGQVIDEYVAEVNAMVATSAKLQAALPIAATVARS